MGVRTRLFYLLIGLHFLRILVAVSHLDALIPDSLFLEVVDYASNVDKSNWTFGYFGQGIEATSRLNFVIHKNDGTTVALNSDKGVGVLSSRGDNGIRFYGFKARYSNFAKDSLIQDLYAKSMGVYLLNKYGTHKVEIVADRCVTRQLAESRPGQQNVVCQYVGTKVVEVK